MKLDKKVLNGGRLMILPEYVMNGHWLVRRELIENGAILDAPEAAIAAALRIDETDVERIDGERAANMTAHVIPRGANWLPARDTGLEWSNPEIYGQKLVYRIFAIGDPAACFVAMDRTYLPALTARASKYQPKPELAAWPPYGMISTRPDGGDTWPDGCGLLVMPCRAVGAAGLLRLPEVSEFMVNPETRKPDPGRWNQAAELARRAESGLDSTRESEASAA